MTSKVTDIQYGRLS